MTKVRATSTNAGPKKSDFQPEHIDENLDDLRLPMMAVKENHLKGIGHQSD